MSGGPLSGIRVLDLTHVGAGPYCGSFLGQLGADVIKIEPIGVGDFVRSIPPYIGNTGVSHYFSAVNSQKRYGQIDLKNEEGKALLRGLIEASDVLLSNMGPGAMERLGFGSDQVRAISDTIIDCRIVGFRPGTEYERLPAFDQVSEAMAGVMSITREPGSPPPLPGLPAADMSGSIYATLAIILAIHQRASSGKGQEIIVPIHDCLLSMMPIRLASSFLTGQPAEPHGRYHSAFSPFGVFDTEDGQVVLAIGSDPLWKRFVRLFPELDDPKYETTTQRLEHRDALIEHLEREFKTQPTSHWTALFQEHQIAAGPVFDTKQVTEDPYVQEMTFTQHEGGGRFDWLRYPVLHSTFHPEVTKPTTTAGYHTREILEEYLDISSGDYERLVEKAIVNPDPGARSAGR